ncbi:MAG TPA: HlyD family efflux transporter periplasmic adaptor subunit [Vicinamibacterales bacterium]|nr:HlyD family efflux transporter periplasmic adaptor subunit [Vicinamibacterales bacterium]
MVDIARDPAILKRRRRRQIAAGILGAVAIIAISVKLSRMEPAPPSVERATLLLDRVKRGTIIREVRGVGTLVPEDTRWISATTDGRVERILLRPGAVVAPDSVIVELSSPSVEQEALTTRLARQSAEASLANLRVQNQNSLLTQESAIAAAEAEYKQAKMQANSDAELAKDKLISQLTLQKSQVNLELARTKLEIEHKRQATAQEALDAQLRVQQAAVEQATAAAALAAKRLASLKVTPGFSGVLQVVGVEVGEMIAPGKNVARVADPMRLKAELKVPETQARDVDLGQPAQVDTRTGIIAGRVSRKDPAAINGTVTIDVTLVDPLPRGAVPDMSVDGTIQLELMANVLNVGRPALGQEESTVSLFRIINAYGDAQRVQVKLGRGSVSSIEVKSGLSEGDEVVLSDMSNYDSHDKVRLR